MSCLLAAFAYNIHNVSLLFLVLSWHTLSIVSSFSCCSFCNMEKPCACVVLSYCATFGATIFHADCGILFSKSCRSMSNATQDIVFQILQVYVKCHTVFIESFHILMYILLTDVWLMISCKLWYDVILIIPWIIQKQLCMVIFFWFCMNFVPSCT